jgi:hypothetical protein
VSCSCRCSGNTSIGRPPPSPNQGWTDINRRRTSDQVCFGWAGGLSSQARPLLRPSAVRA